MKKINKILLTATAVVAFSSLTGCSGGMGSSWGANENGSDTSYAVEGGPSFLGKDGRLTVGDKAVQDEFYFAFDRSELTDEARADLKKHARYLLKNPTTKVRVEGHTDERGSREYNIALGERRAKSVSKELLDEGVLKDQVAVVSFGEEKPAVMGHDENAWKWNRRAKVAYELG